MLDQFKPWRWIAVIGIVLLLALLATSSALAGEVYTDGSIVIDSDTQDDVYAAGETITVTSGTTIDGDLIAVGGTLTIEGTVTGDVLFAGQTFMLNGEVGDDLRFGGAVLIIESGASVGDDLNLGGYALEMQPGSRIGGDAFFGAYKALLGDIAGDVAGGGNGVRVAGEIGGDAELGVGDSSAPDTDPAIYMWGTDLPDTSDVPAGLTFSDGGSIAGDLTYQASRRSNIPDDAVAGSVTFEQDDSLTRDDARYGAPFSGRAGRAFDAFSVMRFVGYVISSFLVMLLVGLVFQRFAPKFLNGTTETLRSRWLASLGVGLLGYIALVILVILVILLFLFFIIPLALTGTSGPITSALSLTTAVIATAFSLATGWLAPVLVALLVGDLILRLFRSEKRSPIGTLTLGLLILSPVLAIPFLGRFLLTWLVGASGLGAAILYLWPSGKSASATVPATGPDADNPPAE